MTAWASARGVGRSWRAILGGAGRPIKGQADQPLAIDLGRHQDVCDIPGDMYRPAPGSSLPRSRPAALAMALAASVALAGCGDDSSGGSVDANPDPMFAEDHPRIYLGRNRDRLAAALTAGRPAAMRFKSIVDTQLDGGNIYAFAGWYAALMGQLTGEARYCAAAVAQVDAMVTEDETRIAAGDNPGVAFDSYLEVGPLVGDAMLTYDWCFDVVTPAQRTRWLTWAHQAVSNVWNPEGATWGGRSAPWSGWSIDNPSNNYYYSFLRATMMLGLAAHGELPGVDAWLTQFRDTKIGAQLVPQFERDLAGGGSREGTGYGVAMARLFELMDFWRGSTGEDLSRLTGHTRASMLHFMHSVVPTLDRVAPVGDHARDSTAELFDYHRNYLQTLAYLFPTDPIAGEAASFLAQCSVPEMDQPFMYVYDFLYDVSELTAEPLTGLGRAYHGVGTGELFVRSAWDAGATWWNLIAGPYSESHAHQDQGSLMIYKGQWLAYDPNVDSRSGINQDVDLHNLVRITDASGTVRMREGTASALVALHRGEGWLHAAADVTAAYDDNPAVSRSQREVVHIEPDVLVVFDRVDSTGGQQIWQLSSPINPTVSGARATFAGSGHSLTVDRVLPAGATFSVRPWADGEYSGGYRLDGTVAGGSVRHLHVLSTDGAVTSVAAADAGGNRGVTINLTDGRTATVRFSPDAVGATLQISGGVDETLAAGVDTLPE